MLIYIIRGGKLYPETLLNVIIRRCEFFVNIVKIVIGVPVEEPRKV